MLQVLCKQHRLGHGYILAQHVQPTSPSAKHKKCAIDHVYTRGGDDGDGILSAIGEIGSLCVERFPDACMQRTTAIDHRWSGQIKHHTWISYYVEGI